MAEKELKVVHISTSFSGGAGTAAFRIHEALLQSNYASSFLSLHTPANSNVTGCYQLQKPVKSLQRRAVDKFIRVSENRFDWKLSKKIYYSNRLKAISPFLHAEWTSLPFSNYNILDHPAVKEADIIHLHWVSGMLDYPSFFEKNTKLVIWTLHDMNPFQGIFHYKGDELRNAKAAKYLDREIYSIKEDLIKKRSCEIAIVTPSKWLCETASESGMFSGVKATSIRNPINGSQYFRQTGLILRNRLGIPAKNTIFLFIAQDVNTYRKGFDLITEALNQLDARDITLLVIGVAGDFKMPHFQTINLGSISDKHTLCSYYSLADAFVIPSREDNLPNVMLEAMACGTPVLSFNIGGMSETIEDGFNGLKASQLNASSLKNILEQFILSKSQFNAAAISEFVIENFSYPLVSEKYMKMYKSCF